jgi:hypothetical protein
MLHFARGETAKAVTPQQTLQSRAQGANAVGCRATG